MSTSSKEAANHYWPPTNKIPGFLHSILDLKKEHIPLLRRMEEAAVGKLRRFHGLSSSTSTTLKFKSFFRFPSGPEVSTGRRDLSLDSESDEAMLHLHVTIHDMGASETVSDSADKFTWSKRVFFLDDVITVLSQSDADVKSNTTSTVHPAVHPGILNLIRERQETEPGLLSDLSGSGSGSGAMRGSGMPQCA